MSRPAWMAEARCAADFGPYFDQQPLIVQIATCTQCPVRAECLAHALKNETPSNPNLGKSSMVWGATTVDQRRKLLRRRTRVEPIAG